MAKAIAKESNIIGLKDLRENMESYISKVQKGRSFTVVKRSRPAFKISPAVDEWGDEGEWKTIIDFREISPNGVPIEDVSKALKNLIKRDEQNRKVSK